MKTSEFSGAIGALSDEQLELLAYLLEEEGLRGDDQLPLVPRTQKDSAPLSFAQARLWFLDRLEPNRSLYNVPWAMRLRGPLAIAALTQALNTLLARHEILRTTFNSVDGSPIQIISEPRPLGLSVIDLRSWKETERELEAVRLAEADARQPFDLIHGPLLRATLIRLGEEDHVMLLTMHHIVSDGWSTVVFGRELSELYQASCKGLSSPLAVLPIQYADFAVWQRNWLQGKVLDEQLSYWKKQLENLPAILDLPTDRPRPPVQSYRGARQATEFSKDLAHRLKALSRKEGVTLFMTLLAAFQVLLHRYTGHDDVVVGSPIAGRNRKEIEGLIGFFVNTLVLRCSLSGNPTFNEILVRVREMALGAYAHQDLPFEKLVEEVNPERSLNHSPLFQVMFVLQNDSTAALQIEGLTVSTFRVESETTKFDLMLTMSGTRDELRASLRYNTDLFAEATIKRMLGHFGTLLEGIVSNPQARISELPMLTDTEKHQLLIKWNDTRRDYPNNKRIDQLFEGQVQQTPDAVAVVFDGQQLTYRELNGRANQLAHYLKQYGVGPEVLVGICIERSIEMVVATLAILKAGGAYVPLDPTFPRERIALILDDAQVGVILTQEKLMAEFNNQVIVSLDKDWKKIAEQSEENPDNRVTAESLAYVMYTSGSTGKPKGVEVPHRAVVRLLINTDYIEIDPSDVIAQVSNCAFDAATFEIWGALLHGARLVIISTQVAIAPHEFSAALTRHQLSALFLTTALFNQLAQNLPAIFRPIRHVLFGGEAVDPRWVREILRSGPPARLVHVYGPTETTTFATWYEIKEVGEDAVTIPIGRPIANTTVYILDSRLQPVPIGVTGELYIGGDGLARGYLSCPELTAEKFVENPFSHEPCARLYKTGDLARYRSDGNIEFLGRIDNQVKLRGHRVELGEIEAALGQHPAVKDNVVVMCDGETGDKRLVAYIVPQRDDMPASGELRSYLKAKLPAYMVPSAFVTLEALPLTTNGKLDYDALSPSRGQDVQEEVEYVAPRDETERLLCRIWSQILGVNRIGIDDDFFAVGGHSLLAAKLFARLDEAFGRSLPLGVLFAAPTIRSLAERYRTPVEPKARSVVVPLRTGGDLSPIFAVPGVFGNVICFADLARELGSEQPFYGLQSVGLDGGEAPLDSIEEIAALYVAEIRSVQARGPYAIVGACFGATVAYEMARQLLAAGEEMGFLGLLDPTRREGKHRDQGAVTAPRIFRRLAAFGSLAADRLQLYREDMRRLGVIDRVKYLASKLHLLSGLIGNSNAFKGAQRELNQIEVYRANLLALDRYRRQPLNGRLRAFEVFETTRPGRVKAWDRIDWPALWKGPIKRHEMPGRDSGDMLNAENVRVLGASLAQQLRLAFQAYQQQNSVERENAQSCEEEPAPYLPTTNRHI